MGGGLTYVNVTLALITDYGATPDSTNNLNVISSVYEVPEDLRYDVYGVKV